MHHENKYLQISSPSLASHVDFGSLSRFDLIFLIPLPAELEPRAFFLYKILDLRRVYG